MNELQKLLITRNNAQAQVDALNKQIAELKKLPQFAIPQFFVLRVGPDAKLKVGDDWNRNDISFCYGGKEGDPIDAVSVEHADREFHHFSGNFPDETYFLVEVKQVYKNGDKLMEGV